MVGGVRNFSFDVIFPAWQGPTYGSHCPRRRCVRLVHVVFLDEQPLPPSLSFLAKSGMTIKCSTWNTVYPRKPSYKNP